MQTFLDHMKKIITLLLISILITGCETEQKQAIKHSINGTEAQQLLSNSDAILLDVRTKAEYEDEHILNAINIPLGLIDRAYKEIPNQDTPIIVYCQSGNRSKEAQNMLIQMGYTEVYDLGSINNWE